MSTIDLVPFCGKDDVREYMHEPFNVAGGTGATNRHILAWVNDASVGKPLRKPLGPKESESIGRLIDRAKADAADPDTPWVDVDNAEIAELRRDAERYRFLANLMRGEPELMGDAYGFRWVLPDGILSERMTLRDAIDAARGGE